MGGGGGGWVYGAGRPESMWGGGGGGGYMELVAPGRKPLPPPSMKNVTQNIPGLKIVLGGPYSIMILTVLTISGTAWAGTSN